MTVIAATFWTGLRDPQGKRFATSWSKLLDRLALPRISADKHAVPGLSLATFKGDRRAKSNVEQVFAVGIDLDHLDALSVDTVRPPPGENIEAPSWESLRARFADTAAFVHTTHSSTMQLPRLRVFLLLSRPVSGAEYERVYRAVATICERGGLVVDRAASDPSRLWFIPSIPAEGRPYIYWTCAGAPIDVDAALASVPPPPPPPPPAPRPLASGGASAFDRARKYLAECDPAVSGSGGSRQTFVVASKMVRGFALSVDDAYALMASEWNPRCSPPWDERGLRRKVEQAATQGRMAEGEMLARERGR